MVEGPELTNIVQTLHCQCYVQYGQIAIGDATACGSLRVETYEKYRWLQLKEFNQSLQKVVFDDIILQIYM